MNCKFLNSSKYSIRILSEIGFLFYILCIGELAKKNRLILGYCKLYIIQFFAYYYDLNCFNLECNVIIIRMYC